MGEAHSRTDTRDADESSRGPDDQLPARRSPSLAVVDAVAVVTDSDPLALDPIANVLDPEALDQLVTNWAAGDDETPASISFEYCGCSVTVGSDGRLTVRSDETVYHDRW